MTTLLGAQIKEFLEEALESIGNLYPEVQWRRSLPIFIRVPKGSDSLRIKCNFEVPTSLNVKISKYIDFWDEQFTFPSENIFVSSVFEVGTDTSFKDATGNSFYGIQGNSPHTAKELSPEIYINVKGLSARYVVMQNREDIYSYRNAEISVAAFESNEIIKELFNFKNGISHFAEYLVRKAGYLDQMNHTSSFTIWAKIFLESLGYNYDSQENLSYKIGNYTLIEKFQKVIKNSQVSFDYFHLKEIFDPLLQLQELEFSQHGVARTFRFRLFDERQKIVHGINKIIEDLHHIDIYAVIGFGTLLGAERGQAFIDHDDDVDLMCFTESELDIERIIASLMSRGYTCYRSSFHNAITIVLNSGFDLLSPISVDLFFPIVRQPNFIFSVNRKVKLNRSVLNRNPILLEGIHVPAPANIEMILSGYYGNDWNVVKTKFSH